MLITELSLNLFLRYSNKKNLCYILMYSSFLFFLEFLELVSQCISTHKSQLVSPFPLPLVFVKNSFNPFSINVPLMQKPGSWVLLAKCLKDTCGRLTF